MLSTVVNALLWAIVVPVGFVANLAIEAVLKFFSRPFDPEMVNQTEIAAGEIREGVEQMAVREAELAEEEVETGYHLLLQIIEWSVLIFLAALIGTLVVVLFLRAYHRRLKRVGAPVQGERESVRHDADLLSDLGNLLAKLAPSWMGRSKKAHAFALPDGHSGVVDVLRIYYQMLMMAETRGFRRRPHVTASEFQETLEGLFPPDLAQMATRAFNHAFYGNHSALEERISSMRTSLESESAKARQ